MIWTPKQDNFGQRTTICIKAFIELLILLGIKSALSRAYHPQTDGTTEQVNQEIEAYTVSLIQKIGHKLYTPWNSITTIKDMQTDRTPI